MPSKDTARKSALDDLLLKLPGVVPGRMFGYPAYYVRGRLFACIYRRGIGVKVPEQLAADLLSRKHIVPFRPLGKPKMREWVQINRTRPGDYRHDLDIFRRSVEFVATGRRKK